ncbi:uncharacterized protein LOC135352102 isoform X2 [Halichondria panicea]|uniref:uncharacterized protein LOC135352102 isoform X2 n=1 Tax=Halichondria panicea TaxID=6063 RepID=UPI00312B6EB9
MAVLPVGHVFVNDFVIVSHPHFGSICVKVHRFYCKGSELHIQAHILLTLDQLKIAFTSVVYLYPEPGALVILESSDFKVTNILTIVSPPSSLLRYMLDLNTLEQLGMKVSVLDMSRPVAEDIKTLQEGITVFDAFLKTEVIVRAPVICLIADNPRAAEVINHRGGSSKKYCRKCMVDREVDPVDVSTLRTKDVSLSQMRTIQSARTESEKESLRTSFGLRERENPMLSLNVDLYQSTPVECLHTILLGPVKYLLKRFIAGLKKEQKAEVLAIVQQFNYSGFDVRLYGNIIKHHCSFVGRDYKAWAQMAAFIVTPYVTTNERKLWLALLKVFRLAYCVPFNPNCSEESRQVCKGFVDLVKEYNPQMLKKMKVHLLLHLVDDLCDFGPTAAFNTERCEAFNSLMREQKIFSNRRAPSRDIAVSFSTLEALRFVCSSGYYQSETNEDFQQCGAGLTNLYNQHAVQTVLNGVSSKSLNLGKAIYQSGALRKKQGSTKKLKDVALSFNGANQMYGEVSREYDIHSSPSFLNLDVLVQT